MIPFKQWLNESAKELAKAYSQSLKPIPQDPKHHPEGNVLTHIKLVRKAIPQAIEYVKQLKTKEPFSTILQDIDIEPSPDQLQLLKLATWLHDIGKIPTTKVDNKRHWTEPGPEGKITSYRHEDQEFYQPEIDKLIDKTPEDIKKLYSDNKDTLDFLIQRHMDATKMSKDNKGLPQKFIDLFKDGKLIPTNNNKLLLLLIYSDKMGRKPQSQESIERNNQALITASQKSKEITDKTKNTQTLNNPKDMLQSLKDKKLPLDKIYNILKNKFGLSSQEIDDLNK